MSTINTNGIDINYPIPGQNNSSQGFRDNFAAIKTNLDTAGTEITDLQNKVVLKAALANTVLNNDMANTLISNASTRGFRATTYNLGNALSGTVLVNVSQADVQYGSVVGNVTLQFTGWSPTGTKSAVELQLSMSNSLAVISFPPQVIALTNDYGVTFLENYQNISNTSTVTTPSNVTQLYYKFSSADCGTSIYVEPVNRGYQSAQIQTRTPTSTGYPGDKSGTVCVDPSISQILVTDVTITSNVLTTSGNTSQLYTDLPIVFTGNSYDANITVGTTYYVKDVVSSNTFTISSSIGSSNVTITANTAGTDMFANPISYLYIATDSYNSNVYAKNVLNTANVTNYIELSNTNDLVENIPITFSGNVIGGLQANTVYYIQSIANVSSTPGNITVARSRTNGVAGTPITLTSANTGANTCVSCAYVGNDIWKRIPLTPF